MQVGFIRSSYLGETLDYPSHMGHCFIDYQTFLLPLLLICIHENFAAVNESLVPLNKIVNLVYKL